MTVQSHVGGIACWKVSPLPAMTLLLLGMMVVGSEQADFSSNLRKATHQDARKLSICDDMMQNGNFDGTFYGWTARGGGNLTLFNDDAATDPPNPEGQSLLVSDRTDSRFGPEYSFPAQCFHEGSTFRVSAYMKLAIDADTAYQPYSCDRQLTGPEVFRDPHVCPLLTFQIKTPGGVHQWVYGNSLITDEWKADEWNLFEADVLVNDVMGNAEEVKMYFERVMEGVDILIDEVKIEELGGDLDHLGEERNTNNAMFDMMNEVDCNHMVLNSDFETGNGEGWLKHRGGKLLMYPYGYANSNHSLLYTARTSPYSGPRHDIATDCVIEGKTYIVEAQIMLLDENGDPFACDKSRGWNHEVSCPLLTIQYTNQDGESKWAYFENEDQNVWVADSYNWYFASIQMTEEMKAATEIFFYFERVKSEVSIVFDNTQFSRDCQELIPNGYSSSSLDGWRPSHGNGVVSIQTTTMNNLTLESYFIHQDRTTSEDGPRQNLDVSCLVEGNNFKVKFDVKLVDSNGNEFICDKHAENGANSCPLVGFGTLDGNNEFTMINVPNRDPTEWTTGFNEYEGILTVNPAMANASSVFFYIRGPEPEYDILFDNVIFEPFANDVNCSELIYNGDAEHGIEEWSVFSGGFLKVHDDGFDTLNGAVAHYDRSSTQSSLTHQIHPECLVEGKHYAFHAYFKLLDENNEPYSCVNSFDPNNPDPCVITSIYVQMPEGIEPIHIPNKSPHIWNATGWNVYRSDFIINFDLALATMTELKIRGPKEGVTVIMDSASMVEYSPPTIDCSDNLVINGYLDDLEHTAWVPIGGSIDLFHQGAFGTNTAILHTERAALNSGLRQTLDTSCFVENKQYQISTFFKLLDEDMMPFQCDDNAEWGSPSFCIVIEIEYYVGQEKHVVNLMSDITAEWDADEWNYFHKVFTASADLSIADQAYLQIKGPRAGVSIFMDSVKLQEYVEPIGSCNQLVKNSQASNGDFSAWRIINSGHFTIVPGGVNQRMAFIMKDRGSRSSAIRQNFDMDCLTEVGQKLEISGLFQLLDSEGVPYACDKSARWGDPLYCLIMSIDMRSSDGVKTHKHYGNMYGGEWIADDFNPFYTIVTVTQDISDSASAFFYFWGVAAGSSIIFDQITIIPVDTTS